MFVELRQHLYTETDLCKEFETDDFFYSMYLYMICHVNGCVCRINLKFKAACQIYDPTLKPNCTVLTSGL